jgi:hypothetical protein
MPVPIIRRKIPDGRYLLALSRMRRLRFMPIEKKSSAPRKIYGAPQE